MTSSSGKIDLPPDPPLDPAVQLHTLENSLASLRLRLGVVAADPRLEDDANIRALLRIADQLMNEARLVREAIAPLVKPGARKPRARRA